MDTGTRARFVALFVLSFGFYFARYAQWLAISHPQIIYRLLFEAARATLFQFGKTEGLQLGVIAVLHTWGQNLSLHPHLHCIVPGGGIDGNGKRSEEHTSELQSRPHLVCRLLLEKKKHKKSE